MSLLLRLLEPAGPAALTLTCEGASVLLDGKNVNLIKSFTSVSGGSAYRIKTEIDGAALFTDTITQANGTILGDTAEWDRWNTTTVDTINSNGTNAVSTTANRTSVGVIVANTAFGPDQWAEHIHASNSGGRFTSGPLVRASSGTTTNGYSFLNAEGNGFTNPSAFRIVKHVSNGNPTTLATSGPEGFGPIANSTTYTMRLEVIGDRLFGYIDGKLIVTAIDSTFTTGQPGFQIIYGGSTISFSAGQIAASNSVVLAQRTLACTAQSYAVTSNNVNLTVNRSLTAAPQSYAVTTTTTNLKVGKVLTAKTYGIRAETNISAPVFSDDFNRADAANLGANWSITQGAFAISSNKVYGGITDYLSIAVPTANYSSNQGAKITVSGDFNDYSDHIGVGVRLSSGTVADYRTWTELDPTSVISKVSNTVSITAMNATSGTGVHGVWYDGGTNWKTGDFWTSVGAVTVTSGGDNSRFIIAGLTNSNTTGAGSGSENRPSIQVRWVGTATTPKIELVQYRSTDTSTASPAVLDFYQGSAVAVNTAFYLEFERVGSVANCRIYSNASHLTLIDTLTINLTEVISIQYYYVAGKSSTGSSATVTASIGATNFDTPQTGYIFRGDGFPDNTRTLRRLSYGNTASIGAPALPPVTGDIVEVTAVGSRISVYINNILKYSVIDTAYTSGKPGITYEWSNTRDVFIDDFYSWNITGNANLKVDRNLAAATQSYAVTSNDANLIVGRVLSCATASYAITLNDAILTKTAGRTLTADPVSFTLATTDIGLIYARRLALDVKTFTIATSTLNLLVSKKLVATLQTYAIGSTQVTFLRGLRVSVTAQAFTLTGPPNNNLLRGRILTADIRSYSLAPVPVNLLYGRLVATTLQTYTLSMTPANILQNRTVIADIRTYSLVRNDANILRKAVLSATQQTYNIAGIQVALVKVGARVLIASPTSLTLGTTEVTLARSRILSLTVYAGVLTRNPANILQNRTVIADIRTYTLSPSVTNLNRGRLLGVTVYAATLTRNPANILQNRTVIADIRTYTLSPSVTNLNHGRLLGVTVYTAVLVRNPADILCGKKVIADIRAFTYTRLDANILKGSKLLAEKQSYNFTFNQLLFARGGFIKVWTGSAWTPKPLKTWNGTAWVSKPLKVWTGSIWRTY